MRFLRAIFGRLALLALGVVGTVVLLELALQAGAVVVAATGRDRPETWTTDHQRILCLGDSNTYGIWVKPFEAYPAQLETVWNERVGSPKVEVVNLGYPGTNSSRVARDLPRMIRTFEPDTVIVMIGVNDFWTVPVPVDRESHDTPPEPRLRVVRLAKLLAGRINERPGLEVTKTESDGGKIWSIRYGEEVFDLGYEKGRGDGGGGGPNALRENLVYLAETAESLGVRLVFMTYPSRERWYDIADGILRSVATETGTTIIDHQEEFAPDCPEGECLDLIMPNHHPTAAGYQRMAHTIVDDLAPDAAPRNGQAP